MGDGIRTSYSGRPPAPFGAGGDAGDLSKAHRKALDLIGENARLDALVSGKEGARSPLFARIRQTMIDLEWLSRAGAPMENRRGHELWNDLATVAMDAVLKEVSVPRAMSPVLMRRSALEAYFSIAGALEACFYDNLFTSYRRWIEKARFELGRQRDIVDDVQNRVLKYCGNVYKDEPPRRFSELLSFHLEDAAFVYAHDSIAESRDYLNEQFREGLQRFGAFQAGFSDLIDMIYDGKPNAGAGDREMWRYAFGQVDDLVRDADNVLTSIDLTLHRLERYRVRAELEEALGILVNFETSHVDSIIDMAMNVLNARATARNTSISYELTPGIEVPSYLKADLFRAVFEPMLNAVTRSDLSASERNVNVRAYMKDKLLQVRIGDSNIGLAGIGALIRRNGEGGLARMESIARRRGWRYSMRSRMGEGAQVTISIDTKDWSSQPPSATGARPTLQGQDDRYRMPSFVGAMRVAFDEGGEERIDSVRNASMFASLALAAAGSFGSYPPPIAGVIPPLPAL